MRFLVSQEDMRFEVDNQIQELFNESFDTSLEKNKVIKWTFEDIGSILWGMRYVLIGNFNYIPEIYY